MRYLPNVIDEMLKYIPETEIHLREMLLWWSNDASYRAPEDNVAWKFVNEEIADNIKEIEENWHFKVISIWSTVPEEQIRKEVAEEKEKS